MTTEADEVIARFIADADPIPNWLGVTTRRDFFTAGLNFVRRMPPAPDVQDGIQTWSNPRLDASSEAADYDEPRHVD